MENEYGIGSRNEETESESKPSNLPKNEEEDEEEGGLC